MLDHLARELSDDFAHLSAGDRLRVLRRALSGRLVFTTSLGIEDQVLTHLIAESGLDIAIVTLDTGRLFPESYDLWALTEATYDRRISGFAPQSGGIEQLVERQGINGFRTSIESRKACCDVRKVGPLGNALAGAAGWITGLRADQSAERGGAAFVTHDPTRNLLKVNPLLDWTRDRVAAFAETHQIPISPLHARGFLSIGCAPCTRAVKPGEPERAGRWWWENEEQKECGLHVGADGRLARSTPAVEATS